MNAQKALFMMPSLRLVKSVEKHVKLVNQLISALHVHLAFRLGTQSAWVVQQTNLQKVIIVFHVVSSVINAILAQDSVKDVPLVLLYSSAPATVKMDFS